MMDASPWVTTVRQETRITSYNVCYTKLLREIWFATTSGPENPAEQPRYQRWKKVAAELGLPVQFEMVGPNSYGFIDLLRMADVAMTTSVAEGFGMAFLEPWTSYNFV